MKHTKSEPEGRWQGCYGTFLQSHFPVFLAQARISPAQQPSCQVELLGDEEPLPYPSEFSSAAFANPFLRSSCDGGCQHTTYRKPSRATRNDWRHPRRLSWRSSYLSGRDYRDRLDALAAAVSVRRCGLWDAGQDGDDSARRDFADVIQKQGDAGRAALLRLER